MPDPKSKSSPSDSSRVATESSPLGPTAKNSTGVELLPRLDQSALPAPFNQNTSSSNLLFPGLGSGRAFLDVAQQPINYTPEQKQLIEQQRAESQRLESEQRRIAYEAERAELRTVFAALPNEQKIEVILAAIEAQRAEQETNVLKVKMLESFIAGEQRQLEKPTTWVGWSERKADQLFAQLGVDPERSARVEEYLQTQKVVFSETQDHDIPKLYKAAAEGSSVVSAVLSLHPIVQSAM